AGQLVLDAEHPEFVERHAGTRRVAFQFFDEVREGLSGEAEVGPGAAEVGLPAGADFAFGQGLLEELPEQFALAQAQFVVAVGFDLEVVAMNGQGTRVQVGQGGGVIPLPAPGRPAVRPGGWGCPASGTSQTASRPSSAETAGRWTNSVSSRC